MDLLVIHHGETTFTVDPDTYATARDRGRVADAVPLADLTHHMSMTTLVVEPDGMLVEPGSANPVPRPSLIGPTPVAALAHLILTAPTDRACPLCTTTTACAYHIATHLAYQVRAQQLVLMPVDAADRVIRAAVRSLL